MDDQRFLPKALIALVIVTAGCLGSLIALCWFLGSEWARAAFLMAEASFACVWVWQRVRLSLQPELHMPDDHEPLVITERFLQQLEYFAHTGPTRYLSPWFHEKAVGLIRRGNVRDLMAYGMWYRSVEQVHAAGHGDELEAMLERLERIFGHTLPEGHNPALTFMAHLWEPLPAQYRPLFFYAVMELLWLWGWAVLRAWGARRHVHEGHEYYTLGMPAPLPADQQPTAEEADRCEPSEPECSQSEEPVLFLHGVGAGLTPYLGWVAQLAMTGRPLILPYFRHVSMRFCKSVPSVEECADALAAITRAHGVTRVAVMGHSYGSLVASSLVQRHPAMVHSLVLLDPVCFGMFMPTLVRTFLYVVPKSTNRVLDFFMWLVSRELHVTTTFCRRFYWSSLTLWPEHFPEHTLVVMGGGDVLSPGCEVKTWLEELTNAKVIYDPHMLHAEFLLKQSYQRYIMAHIKHMWRRIDAANAVSGPGSVAIDEDWTAIDASCWEAADAAAPVDGSDAATVCRHWSGDDVTDDDSLLASDDDDVDDDSSSTYSGSSCSSQSTDGDALAWLQQAAAAVAAAARDQIYMCSAAAEAAAQALLADACVADEPDTAAGRAARAASGDADSAYGGDVDAGVQQEQQREQGLRRRGHRVMDSAGSLSRLLGLGMGGKLAGFGAAEPQPVAVEAM